MDPASLVCFRMQKWPDPKTDMVAITHPHHVPKTCPCSQRSPKPHLNMGHELAPRGVITPKISTEPALVLSLHRLPSVREGRQAPRGCVGKGGSAAHQGERQAAGPLPCLWLGGQGCQVLPLHCPPLHFPWLPLMPKARIISADTITWL